MHLPRQSRAMVMISGRLRAARRHALLPLSGLLLIVPMALPVAAQDAPVENAPGADPIASHMTEAAQRFGVLSIPATLLFVGGKEKARLHGVVDAPALVHLLRPFISPESEQN